MRAASPFASWSLKTKFALGSGALMFVFSLALTSWTLTALEADVRSGVTSSQLALARSAANDLDAKIEQRRAAMLQVAAVLATTRPAPGPQIDAFFAASPLLATLFDALVVVDGEGRIVFDSPRGPGRVGDNLGDRDVVRQALSGRPMTISSPVALRTTGEPAIVFATPLRAPDGRVEGALLGRLEFGRANFLGALGAQRIGREGFFTVIENGPNPVFVVHGHKERILKPATEARSDPRLAPALAGQEGSLRRTNSLGVETLSCFVPLRSVPWVLFTVYPTSEAFAQLRERRREVAGVGIALFLVAAAMAWLMAGWLLRPLSDLRALIDRHAEDPGLAMSPRRAGSAELAAVVAAYNTQSARRREVEQQLRSVADNLPVLISYIDREQRCLFLNATFESWLGIDRARATGQPVAHMADMRQLLEHQAYVKRCLQGERLTFESEIETLEGRKTLHTVFVPDLGPDGRVVGVYALGSDVTALRDAERQLSRLVRCDALTGLANRYRFDEALPQALARGARSGRAVALMFLDVDHFKAINDSLGHAGGDAALKEIARRLQRSVRATDLVARLAGDEFVVILEDLRGEHEPQQVARKVLEDIEHPFDIDGRQTRVTVSVGIAYRGTADAGPAELLASADAALYAAKGAGRNDFRMAVTA